MPDSQFDFSFFKIKIDGTPLVEEATMLADFEIDTTIGMPDMAVMRFVDPELELANKTTYTPGKSVEIAMGWQGETPTVIFKGEIVAIEPIFDSRAGILYVLRAYDKLHRLTRQTKYRSFVNITYSDIVTQLAGEVSLSPDVDATTEVIPQIIQDNITNFAFLEGLAREINYALYADNDKLCFKKTLGNTSGTEDFTLNWGINLFEFRPRLSLARQVAATTVKSWDAAKKIAVSAKATADTTVLPTAGIAAKGVKALASPFGDAEHTIFHPGRTESLATEEAKGALAELNAQALEAEGICAGIPTLKAGHIVLIKGVGTNFEGKYKVSALTHQYNQQDGYRTIFRVEGMRAKTISDLILDAQPGAAPHRRYWAGVYPALVTNNKNDGAKGGVKAGSVKVKFPWLGDDTESFWARMITIGAGDGRGFHWLPEINDEVMVAFEDGDFNRPYILGSVWGKDTTPETEAKAVKSDGKVAIQTIKTRAGHIIRFTDTDGDHKIEVLDGKTKTKIILDGQNEKITIESAKDILIEAKASGNIDIKNGSGPINIQTQGNVDVKAQGNVGVKATGTLALEGTGGVTIKGSTIAVDAQATLDLKGGASTTVQASGITTVKGSLVKIN
jgi:phage protein D